MTLNMKIFFLFIAFAIVIGVEARLGEQLNPNDRGDSEEALRSSYDLPVRLSERDLEMDEVPILVKYKTKEAEERTEAMSNSVGPKLKRVKTVAAKIDKSKLKNLEEDPDVELVELDEKVFLYNSVDVTPYGVRTVFGGKPSASAIPEYSNSAACSDTNAMRVGIIDSGIAADHPDLPCGDINDDENTRCMGKAFYLDKGYMWSNSNNSHGSHVAGTVGALGNNGYGVSGVVADGQICYLIARVFGDDGSAQTSTILEATDWLVSQGAKIINMSLGGAPYSSIAQEVFTDAWNAGAVLVAAAGNSGKYIKNYPASYNFVMSVAAVDEALAIADFSDYNEEVDIAAPGVGVISTVPSGAGSVAVLSSSSFGVVGGFLAGSASPSNGGTTGKLVDCGFGMDQCEDATGQICLIRRGNGYFSEKALNCEKSGGKGAVIYNNKPGMYEGTLGSSSFGIPVMALSLGNGETLLDEHTGETFTIATEEGYAFLSGTSMAAPHVTGAAALVWRSCPACTNQNVTDCLESTAIDLGKAGKDIFFGSGLIQVDAAYECLSSLSCCVKPGPGAGAGSKKGSGPSSGSGPLIPSPSASPSMSPSVLSSLSIVPTVSCRDKKASCTSDSQCCSNKCKTDKKSDTGTCK